MLFSATRAKAMLQKLAHELLHSIDGKEIHEDELISKASTLASYLLEASLQEITGEEKKISHLLHLLVKNPEDKVWAFTFIDTLFRPKSPEKFLLLLQQLISRQGFPSFLNPLQRFTIKLVLRGSRFAPQFAAKILREICTIYLIKKTAPIVCTTPQQSIKKLVNSLRSKKFLTNLNHLGEAIVGEEEAKNRLQSYVHDLNSYRLDMISIKLSSIYSQINNAAFDETLQNIIPRFEALLHVAMKQPLKPWLMLDMEEWKDLEMTVELLTKTLWRPCFKDAKVGIALQAYIPSSSTVLQQLIAFSKERVEQGHHPCRVRIVKGANLLMEQLESRLKGWPQAPYHEKIQTDAHFKYMVDMGLDALRCGTLEIGIGSHNLFDISYAAVRASALGVLEKVQFETLAGMAAYCSRTLVKFFPYQVALYCPTVKKEEFFSTLAYLLRRLDENTGVENFLTTLLELEDPAEIEATTSWKRELSRFCQSLISKESCPRAPYRIQNRTKTPPPFTSSYFKNCQDSDFSLAENRAWLQALLVEWREKSARQIPIQVGGEFILGSLLGKRFDPSRPGYLIHEHHLATQSELQQALAYAYDGALSLLKKPPHAKAKLLFQIADLFEKRRGTLLGAIVQEVAKNALEADQEISEAIDFIRYYAHILQDAPQLESAQLFNETTSPPGIAFIASPWNFPCSIPVNAIVAALVVNKSILFKPSPEAIGVGWEVAQLFWEGGILHSTLQFVPTKEDPEGYFLLHQPSIDTLFLTGATQTARLFLQQFPKRHLLAETGGKNAIIVTECADIDLALQGIISSAFGYSGQKCSACSLLLVEETLYFATDFLNRLRDATASLVVGPAWNPLAKITPLAKPPSTAYEQARMTLELKERWLLEPIQDPDNSHLFSPGIKIDVNPNSFTFKSELFGPLLAVAPIKNLSHGLELANSTMYGLTAGLYSLNTFEQDEFCRKIEAGNRYINRPCTGAIVGRQPFGGIKASSFGLGMKAGGPTYLLQLLAPTGQTTMSSQEMITKSLLQLTSLLLPKDENVPLVATARNYATAFAKYYREPREIAFIKGQHNFLEYRPIKELFLFINKYDSFIDLWPLFSAAALLEIELKIGGSNLLLNMHTQTYDIANFASCYGWKFYHSTESFLEAFFDAKFPKIRAVSLIEETLLSKLAARAYSIDVHKPSADGRVELLHFLQELSTSIDYHRFGNCLLNAATMNISK